jgi:hypothetical protein
VWVSDSTGNRIVEFSSTGALLQTFGGLGSTTTTFNNPHHLAIFATGTSTLLFVADSWNDRVQVFTISD